MPRVELYQGDRVRTRPLPDLRRTPPPAGAFGEQFGETLSRVGPALVQLHQEQQQRANELALTTAKRQFNELYQLSALSAPEQRGALGVHGLMTMRGIEPHEKLEQNVEDWNAQAGMIVESAKNPTQRALFEALRDQERARYVDQAMQHASNEFAKYEVEQTNALNTSTIETAAAAAGTPGYEAVIASHLDTLRTSIQVNGAKIGLQSQEQKDLYYAQARSKLQAAVVTSLISQGQDLEAQRYFDQATAKSEANPQGQLLEGDATPLRAKLEVNTTDGFGKRTADAIFDAMGPKRPGDPVNIFDMKKEARLRAGDDAKKYARTVDYLQDLESAWNQQHANIQSAVKNPLHLAVAQGLTLAQIRQLPAWTQADAGVQADVIEAVQQRARQADADARAARAEIRGARADQMSAIRFEHEMQEYAAAPAYTDLALDPARLATMSEGDLQTYMSEAKMTLEQMTALRRMWTGVQGNLQASEDAKVDTDIFKQAVYDAGYKFVFKPSQSKDERATIGLLHQAVQRELIYRQSTQARATGGKVVFSPEEQREVINFIVTAKAMGPGWISGTTIGAPAALKQDDLGRAYIPFAQIPTDMLTQMRNYLASRATVAGVTGTRRLSQTEIDARYADAMQRAAVQAFRGGGPTVWQPTLDEAIRKYSATR